MFRTTQVDLKQAVIRVRGLVNRFGHQTVHDGLDLDVRRGEVLGLVGGSGSGKSVLMRTLIGLQRPAAGSVEIFGHDITAMEPEELRRLERRWGVLFQEGALFSSMTVASNIVFALRENLDMPEPLMREIADVKIALAGLPEDAADKFLAQLSGGMRRRAGLARALALDPELLFLDEPTSGLDPDAADGFDRLIKDLQMGLDLTVFLITHDLDTLFTICDRIAVLVDKKVRIGTPEEMLRDEHPWVRDMLQGPRGRGAQMVGREQRAAFGRPIG